MKTKILRLLVILTLFTGWHLAVAQSTSTTISYQGLFYPPRFTSIDVTLSLYATNTGGTPIGGPITNVAVPIGTNGLFSTTMDFGSNVFSGGNYFLEIAVRTNGGGAFTTLSPRQPITPAPQSIYALNAGAAAIAASATSFSGTVSGDVLGTQGATVVASVGGQTAASVASGVIAANGATSADVPNTIVARDSNGAAQVDLLTIGANYLVPGVPPVIPPHNLTLSSSIFLPTNGAICLPFPAIIYSGTNTMIIEQGSLFMGAVDFPGLGFPGHAAGTLATGAHDVGVGDSALSGGGPGFGTFDSGSYNTAIGEASLQFNSTGSNNTAGGYASLRNNTSGSDNKADGYEALFSNTIGSSNTAIGYQTLYSNTSGSNNTANGAQALFSNTSANGNTAEGYQALYSNTTGSTNTGNGYQALRSNTTGRENTAEGFQALYSNNSASQNTASGTGALHNNTAGADNSAVGWHALFSNTLGNNNTAAGPGALGGNTSGGDNTASGFEALFSNTLGNNNTADGFEALFKSTAGNNIGVGFQAGFNLTTGTNDIYIGNPAAGENFVPGESTAIRIGTFNNVNTNGPYTNTYIAGIWDTTFTNSAMFVVVDSGGHLGTSAFGPGTATNTTIIISNGIPGCVTNLTIGACTNCTVPQFGVLNLPVTTGPSVLGGMITLGGCDVPFLHGYGVAGDASQNFFGGFYAGNFTMTGNDNTAVGAYALSSDTTGSGNTAQGVQALATNQSGSFDTAVGVQALYGNTGAYDNTAVGYQALYNNDIDAATSANNNTAIGYQALYNNVDGQGNTASGAQALFGNHGSYNTASGAQALYGNNTGVGNTAIGYWALYFNNSGSENTASGNYSLLYNTTGSENTADGNYTMVYNLTGNNNTASGNYALLYSVAANNNTANGAFALMQNDISGAGIAKENTAAGVYALAGNLDGFDNTAAGYDALASSTNGIDNTADGAFALNGLQAGTNIVAVGYGAGQNLQAGNNDIYIGNQGTGENFSPSESDTIRIGSIDNLFTNGPANTYIAGIWNNYSYTNTPMAVYVDAFGHLGVLPSSGRFKQNVQTMGNASDVLLSLRPVTYQYKPGVDPNGTPQFGLVAEEVEKVDPDLVVHDDQHRVYGVRYEAVNAMLLNEFQKEHRKVEEQQQQLTLQDSTLNALQEKAAKVDSLEEQNKSLTRRLNELETLVKALAEKN